MGEVEAGGERLRIDAKALRSRLRVVIVNRQRGGYDSKTEKTNPMVRLSPKRSLRRVRGIKKRDVAYGAWAPLAVHV